MRPIEKVFARLPDHKPSGDGYKACCPAHEDRKPSLSIKEAPDGTVLLKCFAGCTIEKIIAATGLQISDLFPDCQGIVRPAEPRLRPRVFATAQEAIDAYGRGKPNQQWAYTDADGLQVGRTIRWATANGKDVRPIAKFPDGWRQAAMPEPRPIFNLPAVLANQGSPVYVAEGEKCVDALTALGFIATTSSGGSQSARLTDWSPLAGRRVIVMPDNDDAGESYAEDVKEILDGLGAFVRITPLGGLPRAGDVADLFDQCTNDEDTAALRGRIKSLYEQQRNAMLPPSTDKESSSLVFQPFPVSALPEPVATFVSETAAAIGCDTAFVALPVLTLLGAAIGNTRRLKMKAAYEAPAILWTGIVGESGTGKTPALKAALAAAHSREASLNDQKESRRFLVGDTTTEALAQLMAANPRGIFCVRDELAGWFGSIDRYTDRKAGCSADQSFLLSAYSGMPHIVDRRTGEPRHLHVPRASLWVTGGIQPGILARAIGKAEREAGLLARLLLACPPAQPQKYSEDDVSATTQRDFDAVVSNLFALDGDATVSLTPDAKRLWTAFHDRTAEEALRLTGDLRAALNKLRDTALRIALIVHLAESASDLIAADTMERAVALAEWFKRETQRVYAILSETPRQQTERVEEESLLAWMAGRDTVTRRDVERGLRCFRATGRAESVLRRLVARGSVEQEHRPAGIEGGPPVTAYRLACPGSLSPTHTPGATQPTQARSQAICVAVAAPTTEDSWTKL